VALVSSSTSFVDEHHLRVGSVDFHCDYDFRPAPDGFLPVMKTRKLVEAHLGLYAELAPRTIVELGIYRGGSTALLHAATRPSALIAVDRRDQPPPALERYMQDHDGAGSIRPHYGVDQSDRDTLAGIVRSEIGDQPIDLVIDDCSHQLEPTIASFEVLFPLLRPGGLYVVEDWRADQILADTFVEILDDPERPQHQLLLDRIEAAGGEAPPEDGKLVRLPLLLVLARASSGDVIRDVLVTDDWVVVRRGAEPVDGSSFRLSDLVRDHFGNLQRRD
jgi:cephalosporin hydroxylase